MIHWKSMALTPPPLTIEEAVNRLYSQMTDSDLRYARTHESHEYHFTVGRSLRNAWDLWNPDSPLKRNAAIHYGIAHADDISGMVLEMLWARIRDTEFDLKKYQKRINDHWLATSGQTALEAGGFVMLTPEAMEEDVTVEERQAWSSVNIGFDIGPALLFAAAAVVGVGALVALWFWMAQGGGQ